MPHRGVCFKGNVSANEDNKKKLISKQRIIHMPKRIIINLPLYIFSLFLSCFIFSGISWAGFQFLDPDIPDNETIIYRSTSEGKTITIKEQVRHITEENNNFYEIVSFSPALDTYIQINRKDMTVLSVHTFQKYADATLDSKLIVKDKKPNREDNAIIIPHFVALSHLLRGFPFESKEKLQINYYGGSAGKKFQLRVKNKQKEVINVMGKEVECYKLEFGLAGFLWAVLPELELWYTVEPPHYMVRYRGPEGPPGTPKRFIELIEYQKPCPWQ